jgi:hypothetical protein
MIVVGLEIERVGVGEQVRQPVGDVLALGGGNADVDGDGHCWSP